MELLGGYLSTGGGVGAWRQRWQQRENNVIIDVAQCHYWCFARFPWPLRMRATANPWDPLGPSPCVPGSELLCCRDLVSCFAHSKTLRHHWSHSSETVPVIELGLVSPSRQDQAGNGQSFLPESFPLVWFSFEIRIWALRPLSPMMWFTFCGSLISLFLPRDVTVC